MKLILQKDVKNLGKAGDQVLVKKGYARNFLIPKGHALPLNKDRLKMWKHQQVIITAKKRKAISERKVLIEKLSSIKLKFEKESLKDGRLFGSVTAFEISQALEKIHNISVDKRDISPSLLKTSGDHNVSISLDAENKTEMMVSIKGKIAKKKDQEELKGSEEDTKPEGKMSFLQKTKMAIIGKKPSEEAKTSGGDDKQPADSASREELSAKTDETAVHSEETAGNGSESSQSGKMASAEKKESSTKSEDTLATNEASKGNESALTKNKDVSVGEIQDKSEEGREKPDRSEEKK